MTSDAGVFILIVGSVQRNTTTLEVEYPPYVRLSGTQKTVEGRNLNVTCSYISGKPPATMFYWTKTDSDFRFNGQFLWIPSIAREDSGTYTCFAENTYSSENKGKANATIEIDVQYPPVVSPLPNVKHVVGDHVKITCVVTAGNPSSTTVYWTKSGNSGFGQSGSSLVFPNISRTQNGIYSCVAENNYLIGGKGTDQQSFLLDVLYGPILATGQTVRVSEGQSARLSTSVSSNPASNVSWFKDNVLLLIQPQVNGTTSYTIARTECTDTGPFLVVASNGVQSNHSTTVSLYVYCSPRLAEGGSSVELSVGSNRYLNGHVLVLSFPQPNASLTLQNGALNTLITLRIETKADNLFTIMLIRSNAQPNVFGKYVLDVTNQYGGTKIDINIIPKSKPFPAAQIKVNCGHEDAFITWQSSYFGYEQQYSYVQYSTDNIKFVNGSDYIAEDNKQEILQITVSDLQDSSVYYFRVNTFNRYGLSSSMSTNCSTGTTQESFTSTSIIVCSILIVLLFLAVTGLVFISYKYHKVKNLSERPPREFVNAIDNQVYEQYATPNKKNCFRRCCNIRKKKKRQQHNQARR
uniref:Ig-like domain-containing protein n=1 Tax=Magallana gigas TaxID=29159 RepID=A0A8W8LGZ3_MAGGI